MNQTRIYLFQSNRFCEQIVSAEILAEYQESWHEWEVDAEKRGQKDAIRKSQNSKTSTLTVAQKIFRWIKGMGRPEASHQAQPGTQHDPSSLELTQNEYFAKQIRREDKWFLTGPIPLYDWLSYEATQLNSLTDRYIRADAREYFEEYLLENTHGMEWFRDFHGTSWLSFQLNDLMPYLPEKYHSRVNGIFDQKGVHLPTDNTAPLAVLNEILPTWTFFTREEIIELRSIVMTFWESPHANYWDEETWTDVLNADEQYEYDWLALYYMFG